MCLLSGKLLTDINLTIGMNVDCQTVKLNFLSNFLTIHAVATCSYVVIILIYIQLGTNFAFQFAGFSHKKTGLKYKWMQIL